MAIYRYLPHCSLCGEMVPLSRWDTSLKWEWWQQCLATFMSGSGFLLGVVSPLVGGLIFAAPTSLIIWGWAVLVSVLSLLWLWGVWALRRLVKA